MPTTEDVVEKTAGYLTLKEVTVRNVNGDSGLHLKGTVLSDWEVEKYVKTKVAEGSHHYRTLLEPLTQQEVDEHRKRATAIEGDHSVDGEQVTAPWPDYVGLHPEEIIARMKASNDLGLVQRVRLYERGGLNRQSIIEYTAPVERPPWIGYDDMNVREVVDKLSLLAPEAVHEVLAYESAHRKRPAILTYEPEPVGAGAPNGGGD